MTYYSILNDNKTLIYLIKVIKRIDKYIKYKKEGNCKKLEANISKNITSQKVKKC